MVRTLRCCLVCPYYCVSMKATACRVLCAGNIRYVSCAEVLAILFNDAMFLHRMLCSAALIVACFTFC